MRCSGQYVSLPSVAATIRVVRPQRLSSLPGFSYRQVTTGAQTPPAILARSAHRAIWSRNALFSAHCSLCYFHHSRNYFRRNYFYYFRCSRACLPARFGRQHRASGRPHALPRTTGIVVLIAAAFDIAAQQIAQTTKSCEHAGFDRTYRDL